MNRLIIVGASGHGKVIADIAKLNGYTDIVFLDDDMNKTECVGYPVIGNTSKVGKLQGDYIIAIGDSKIRENLQLKCSTCILVHPNAIIGSNVSIGKGTVIMAGVVINADCKIGQGCIINTSSSVDHDCIIGDFVHVSVGAHVAGTCSIGDRTWIGAGSTISNNICIINDCLVGAGAVVVNDILNEGTYLGVPAKRKVV